MINQERLEKLLSEEESVYLEYKEKLDFDTNWGKAKFLREVLSLANSPVNVAYLIIGVEDKTKKLAGVTEITEEQIQQIVFEWCRPSINLQFQTIEHKEKTIGVIEIYPARSLYRLRKPFGYEEPSSDPKKRKQGQLKTNQIFVRQGSVIVEADIDEILEMAQRDTPDLSDVVSHLDRMNESFEEIASRTRYLRNIGTQEEPNEVLETIFVSLTSAVILGSLWNPTNTWLPLAALPLVIIIMVVLSALRIIHFGVGHMIIAGPLVGIALTAWLSYGSKLTSIDDVMANSMLLGILYHGLAGAMAGLIIGIILMFWRPKDFS